MYTYVRRINYTRNYMRYLRGETKRKAHPEKIHEIQMPPSQLNRSTKSRCMQMRMDTLDGDIENFGCCIQITLSPCKEDTEAFDAKDWKNLWIAFLTEWDKIDEVPVIRAGQSQLLKVGKTNLLESNQLVALHKESLSGIPHIHAAISPIDKNGHKYDLTYLTRKAKIAAQEVSRKFGFVDSTDPQANTLSTAFHTCLETIESIPSAWSWKKFKNGIRKRGYQVLEKHNSQGYLTSWAMKKDNTVFEDRYISEDLCPCHIYSLWHSLRDPYVEPLEARSSEEIIEDLKKRGCYDRFLKGDARNQKEKELFNLLRHKLLEEEEEKQKEELWNNKKLLLHEFDDFLKEDDCNQPEVYEDDFKDEFLKKEEELEQLKHKDIRAYVEKRIDAYLADNIGWYKKILSQSSTASGNNRDVDVEDTSVNVNLGSNKEEADGENLISPDKYSSKSQDKPSVPSNNQKRLKREKSNEKETVKAEVVHPQEPDYQSEDKQIDLPNTDNPKDGNSIANTPTDKDATEEKSIEIDPDLNDTNHNNANDDTPTDNISTDVTRQNTLHFRR